MKEYDVVIIGAGTAGLSARKIVAKKTNNYLVVDNGTLGTTCARVGCMPSKVLLQVAQDFHRRHEFRKQGIHGAESISINQKEVMEYVRKLRDRFTNSVLKGFEDWKSEHFLSAHAKFTGPQTLDLDGEEVKPKSIIIATGSSPIIPAPWKEFSNFFLTSDEIFEQTDLPKKMGVIGLGAIGIELGQAFQYLGVNTTAIAQNRSIAGLTDPALVEQAIDHFSQHLHLDFTGVQKMQRQGDQLKLITRDNEYLVDKALLSVGRRPNLASLELEKAQISLDQNGVPKYDPTTLRVADTRIFIAGDANNYRPILHESSDEGVIAGYNALLETPECFQRKTPLAITFCSPNICITGKSYRELKEQGYDFAQAEASFKGQGRAIVMQKNIGALKLYGDQKTKKLVGAEVFAPQGEHLAHLIAWSIQKEMDVQEILRMPFYHPVIEEGLRTALRNLEKQLGQRQDSINFMRCEDHPTNE